MLPLRKYAKKLHEKEPELYVDYWLNVEKAIKNGTAKPCFCLDLVRAQDELRFSDPLADVSGSLLEAGSDTTAATLVGCECIYFYRGLELTVFSCAGDGVVS